MGKDQSVYDRVRDVIIDELNGHKKDVTVNELVRALGGTAAEEHAFERATEATEMIFSILGIPAEKRKLGGLEWVYRYRNPKDMKELMMGWLNSFSDDELPVFAKLMMQDHPTLKQKFTKLCVQWFIALAKVEYCDLRLEASVNLAKKLQPELEEACLPFI